MYKRIFLLPARLFFLCFLMLTNFVVSAQSQSVEMADVMRSNGKIYIVVAVCLTILIGLFVYLFSLDRKISKIEKENRII